MRLQVFAEKPFEPSAVSKRFRPAFTNRRVRSGYITIFEAFLRSCSL